MKSKLHAHARRNKLFYTIAPVILILVCCALVGNFHAIYKSQKTFYTSSLEHQSLSELDLYHEGSRQLVKEYFSLALTTIGGIAVDPTTAQQVSHKQTTPLAASLHQQLISTHQFNSLTILDAKGAMAAFESTSGQTVPVGTDETKSAAWLAGKDAQSVVLIELHHSALNRNVLSIAAPIRDKDGKLIGVASGAMTLDNLAKHVSLTSSYDKNFSALLTDNQGNALLWKNKATTTIQNFAGKEPVLKRLTTQAEVPTNQEFNFEQQDSFARGSAIDFGSSGKLYLVSYYALAGYEHQMDAAGQAISKTLSGFIIRDALFTIISLIVVAWAVRCYEERT